MSARACEYIERVHAKITGFTSPKISRPKSYTDGNYGIGGPQAGQGAGRGRAGRAARAARRTGTATERRLGHVPARPDRSPRTTEIYIQPHRITARSSAVGRPLPAPRVVELHCVRADCLIQRGGRAPSYLQNTEFAMVSPTPIDWLTMRGRPIGRAAARRRESMASTSRRSRP